MASSSILAQIGPNLVAIGNLAFRNMVDDVQRRAQENTARGRPGLIARSGALRRSIKKGPYRQFGPNQNGEQQVYSDLRYARVQEEGATIRPRSKPFLVFRIHRPTDTSQATGPWVRARQVTIPPRPFLNPAAQRGIREWPTYVEAAMRRILRTVR